jgi:hypothetical protein
MKNANANGHASGDKSLASKRGKTIRALLAEYTFDPKMSPNQRLAHFLDWLAQRAPYVAVPANVALQAIQGYARTPNANNEEVRLFAKRVSKARLIMLKVYKRGLVVQQNIGMRATVDDEDCADTQQRRNVERLVSATNTVKATAQIIDPSKIQDDKLRSWIKGGVASVLRALDADARLDKLLPPPREEEK